MISRNWSIKGVSLALLLFLLLGLLPKDSLATGQPAQAVPGDPAWYHVLQAKGILWALGVDGKGDGWIAEAGFSEYPQTRMLRLQGGKFSETNNVFTNTVLVEIALSTDGATGWAAGNVEGNKPAAALLQLDKGKWSASNTGAFSSTIKYISDMTLDETAQNGWAVGRSDPDDVYSSRLLQLDEGVWRVSGSVVPEGIGLVNISADPALLHVWASGVDDAGDAALLQLVEDEWVPVEEPIGHYKIFDLGVDAEGNGWAGLDTNDEPSGSPSPSGFVRFAADGTWQLVESETLALSQEIFFSRLELQPNGYGWAIGNRLGTGAGPAPLVILALDGDEIVGEQFPAGQDLAGKLGQQPLFGQANDLAVGPAGRAWAVTFEGSILRYGTLPPGGAIPSVAPRLPGDEEVCFSETDKCLHGLFLSYWKGNGGKERFGLPVTGELWERLEDGKVYRVQYTERARFEEHLENPARYQVLLGLLGNRLAEGRDEEEPFKATEPIEDARYFEQTGHNISGPIGEYWRRNGGLPVFGYPISEPFEEVSPTDGKPYLVQYFERNRLEYHPEYEGTSSEILLGLLGVQQFERVYGRKP